MKLVGILVYLIMFTVTLSCGKLFAFSKSDTLVKLSTDFITSDEYLNRCDFSYPLKKNNNISNDSLKKEFLFSLIAEKLWASESLKLNLDTSAEYQSALYPIRKFYVNDELYTEEIASKIKITPRDISDGRTKFRETLKMQILSATDSIKIYSVYKSLLSGKTFQDIPKEIKRTNESVNIIFGQIQDENVENIIYKLKVGYYSNPIYSEGKWFIFKLIERGVADISGLSSDAINMNVEQTIYRRRSSNLENRYRDSLFAPLRIETNGEIFKKLCSIVSGIMIERYKEKNWDTSKAVVLYQSDLAGIVKGVGENNFESPFILFEKNPLTLHESLLLLPYKPFKLKYPSLDKVVNVFKTYFRYVIEQEILYREGVKQNLQYRRNVQDKISIWNKSIHAGMYSSHIWDSYEKKSVIDTLLSLHQRKDLFEEDMEKQTASLFTKYNVQINASLLQDLKISPLNMYTIQHMGFGNELPAFPVIVPYFEWVFRINKNPLP